MNGGWITKYIEWINQTDAQWRPTILMADQKIYQKHENKTNNLNGNTNNSSNHNNNDKRNNLVQKNNKNSYKNNNIIITIKMV